MGRSRYVYLFLIFLAAPVKAEQLKTVFNPFTGKLDYITKVSCGTSPIGTLFTDSNNCNWCETINTSGVLSTTLIACIAGLILMEDATYVLQEDGTKIAVE